MKIEDFIEHANQLMAMGLVNVEGLPLVDIKSHAEKQNPKEPIAIDRCPNCKSAMDYYFRHCPDCGQRLGWKE